MADAIQIVDYDPSWPAQFEQEKERLLAVAGEWLVAVEHVGSTAVPGLAAKPVIDMLPVVEQIDLVQQCVGPIVGIGYEYLGEYGLPGRHYFRKPHGSNLSE